MNKRKKTLRQLVVALLLLCTIGLPIQNIVLANEFSATEEVVTEATEIKESAIVESNTSNSESVEKEIVVNLEKTESSEKASPTTKQSEERPATKNVTTGTFPSGSTATWNFDDATGTLSISGGTLVNPNKSIQNLIGIPVSEITNIVLEGKVFASGSLGSLFWNSVATSLDLSNLDTSNVTDMSGMFSHCAATSLDVSNFDTSNVTDMEAMFYDCAATSLDLSNFDTSNVTEMRTMFCYSAVTSLDLSNFDTSNAITLDMLYASQLQNLTLGSRFQFFGQSANLINPTPTAKYTGKWQNVGTGTVDRPKGSFVGTATELMTQYNGSTMADTYVWQPVLAPVAVNVKDSTLMQGDTWNPEDNFVDATDSAGDPVDFKDIAVTGSVDTTQSGVYTVDYSYGGMTSTATITVLETMPASWINFFVDGTNVRSIPGSALSTPEWNLTTGLWDKWNPGAIKVPTDKLPSEPTKQGYEFKGWKDATGAIVDFSTLDLDLNSQNEFDFYAALEKKEYTVIFDVEGTQKQETVPFEDLVTEPTVPYKAGYAFTGWYDAESGGNKWDFSTDTMPSRNMTLYARFNKLGFVTPEIKPVMPNVVTPIMPGVDPVTPSVKPPTKPGEGPNVVSPSTPGFGGNQISSNGSGSNTGNMTLTSQGNAATASPTSSQGGKLAKLGEDSSLLLQGFGLLLVLSGMIFFWKKRKKMHL
ncbi:BspA family leucine-rich repeat surface protein [Listeria monocytogenes]|nr:BspA family leucine-rich repeat surface protein [Listeria monocytogenes]HAO5827693.1 BspA family leucine-rich repeat surface protein [Listeria monocytogenes]HAO5932156.1 BspA family leucine-rich repeat surface protein [Listeria monocytogenes]